MPEIKIIIAATDGSQGAERAIAIAADLAKITNSKLLIVNGSEDRLSTAQIRLADRLRVSEGDALEEISVASEVDRRSPKSKAQRILKP